MCLLASGLALSLLRTQRSASITVFPVTKILVSSTPSLMRFCLAVSVGAKCNEVSREVNTRFASSGQGDLKLFVRKPASTCPTGI